MNLILFLAKMLAVSGMLYSYYWFFLRNKKFHQYNRFYLLSIPAIAICLPLLNIPIPGFYQSNHNAGISLLKAVTVSNWEDAVIIIAQRNWFHSLLSWQNIAWGAFIIVAFIFLYSFVRSLFYIRKIERKYPHQKMDAVRFYQTQEPGTPFSFLKNIFWNSEIDTGNEQGKQIFRHELYHVKHKHTADILFMESVNIIFWFNPFFHLIKKEIKTVHEFLADQYAASETNRHDYAELLVWQSINHKQLSLINPFFHNQIKRRVAMITKLKNSRYGYISRIMALPLLFILFCAFAVRLNTTPFAHKIRAAKPLTVMIDAGHGGIDPGTNNGKGALEKNINLLLAKKIKELSKEYNINVIMTRESDELPGNANSIKEGLINRVNIAESNNAEALISIHTDAGVPNTSADNGFEIFLSAKNTYYQKSLALGSALTAEIKKTYSIAPELKQRQKGITVLQTPKMPAVMIECGYITNKNDLAFITDAKNQEKIARDILEGIVKYSAYIDQSAGIKKDTASPAELNNINPNDIHSMNVSKEKNLIVVNLKNGDSVIIKADEFEKYMKENKIKPQNDSNIIFTKVEVEAVYPGGQGAWTQYLIKNLKYPPDAIKRKVQGTVLMQFIVEADGSINDIKVLERPDPSLSEASYKIIQNSGKWVPAMQNGKKVRSYKKQPIIFKL